MITKDSPWNKDHLCLSHIVYIAKLVRWSARKSPHNNGEVTPALINLEIASEFGHCRKLQVVSILKSLVNSKTTSGFNIEIASKFFSDMKCTEEKIQHEYEEKTILNSVLHRATKRMAMSRFAIGLKSRDEIQFAWRDRVLSQKPTCA
jgi:hypothetical protein